MVKKPFCFYDFGELQYSSVFPTYRTTFLGKIFHSQDSEIEIAEKILNTRAVSISTLTPVIARPEAIIVH